MIDDWLPPQPTLGVFYGRVVAIHENGTAQVHAYTGPHVVVIPAELMNGTRVGQEVRYSVSHRDGHLAGHGLPAVTRLIAMPRFR